jgi:hypothetical protein
LHLQSHLARNDAAHIEQIFDDFGLRARVTLDHFQTFRDLRGIIACPQDIGPTKNGIERSAQLMGEDGEKFVFHASFRFRSFQRLAFACQQLLAFDFGVLAFGDIAKTPRPTHVLLFQALDFGVALKYPAVDRFDYIEGFGWCVLIDFSDPLAERFRICESFAGDLLQLLMFA